jgi:hypothetical protein
VVGGYIYQATDTVELISLDPKNNPVPDRFKNLNKFPVKIFSGGGACFSHGNFFFLVHQMYSDTRHMAYELTTIIL